MANEPDDKPAKVYQAVNFHFSVLFDDDIDVRFQSVTGLDASIETETVKEGGENRFEHVIPVRRKYGPLILKRGILKPSDSALTRWLQNAFEHEQISPKQSLTITLLNEQHQPLLTWMVTNVWPRSWKLGELNAEQGGILIETLELNYNILVTDPGEEMFEKEERGKPRKLKRRNVRSATTDNTERKNDDNN